MPTQIVPVEEIQRRARQAVQRGLPREACPFNWHADAYRTWHDEYTRATEKAAQEEASHA